MAKLTNLQYWIARGNNPHAHVQFDLTFQDQELLRNQPVDLCVTLEHTGQPTGNAYAAQDGLSLLYSDGYQLSILLQDTQEAPAPTTYTHSSQPELVLQSVPGANGIYTNGKARQNGAYKSANGMGYTPPYATTPPPATKAAPTPPANEQQVFVYNKRLQPSGRRVLHFTRQIPLPELQAAEQGGKLQLLVSEDLRLLRGAPQLQQLLALQTTPQNLLELLPTASQQRVRTLAASLWRTRQPEELLLQLQAPGAQPMAFRARFTFRDSENLVPEIAIYLERTEGVSDHAVAALLDKLYGTHPAQAVALVDTEGVLHWQNTHFAQLFQTHTHRVPTAAVLKHYLEDRQLALELHTRIAQGQQLRQEVSLYLDNRSIPAMFYLEPLDEVSPGHLLLCLDFGGGSKQLETQLQLAEQKLQSMVEGAPVGICVTDEHGILESVNEAYCFIYGYRKEELIGHHFTKMVPKSQVEAWKKAHARFIDGKQDTRGEFTVMDKEGRERIVMSDSTRTVGLDGRPRKITFVLDITEQKRQERELRTSEDRLMRIFETAPIGICITGPSGNFEVINDAYSRMYGYSKEELVGQPFTKIVPPSQVAHWNAVHDKFIAGQTETRGEFTVRHKNGHDMIVLAESTRITGSDGQPRKVTFVLDITDRKTTEMQMAQNLEETRATQEAMRATQEELQRSESRYRKLLQHAPVGICVTDPHGNFESVNKTYCHIYGYHEEDLVGKPFTMVVPKDKHQWWMDKHNRFMAGEDETRGEFNVIDSRGRTLTILADSTRTVGPDGQPRKVTFVIDITDRKEAEQRMRASEQRLASLIETAPMGICITGEHATFESVNSTYCQIYGYTPDELIGQPFTKIVPKDQAQHWLRTHDRFLAGETETRGEFTVINKKGERLTIMADSMRITGADGKPKKVTFVLDITERKKYESQLKESEQRLASLVETAPMGICVTGEHATFESVNSTYCQIYGYTPDELIGQPFTKIVPKDQAQHWLRTHDRFLAGETETRGEFTVINKKGERLTIMADSMRITGADGKPKKVTFVLDITERKKYESQLKASEERLAALINTAPVGICVTNARGEFDSVNETYCRIYGYHKEDLIGKSFTKIVPQEQAQHWLRTHDRFLAGETETRGEFTVVHASGKHLTILADSIRITGSDGEPKKVTFVLDITDRKEAEQRVRYSEERMRTLIETAPVGICVTNERAEFESVNDAYLGIYGYQAQELIGKPFTTIVPPGTADLWLKTHDKFLAGQTHTRGEFEVLNKKGERIVVMADSALITGTDGKPRKVTFVVDITQQKRQEDQMREANRLLESSKQELQTNVKLLEQQQQELERSSRELLLSKTELEKSYSQLQQSQQRLEQQQRELEASNQALMQQQQELARSKAQLESSNQSLEQQQKELERSQTELQQNNDKLRRFAEELEASRAQLEQSNRELTEKREDLEKALNELQSMQGQLVISEKMAALGQLIAGVAHEVNTPISAVKASVRNMMRDMPEAMDELPKLLAKIPKTQIELVQEFLHEVISTDVTLSTKEERSTRMELEDILSGNDVENAESIADTLVEIRVVRNVERYVPIFTGKYVDAILATALKLGQLKVNLSNIDMASEKTDRIVKALKNYSYVQSTDRLVPTDLSDSVESILTLMNNQLKYGIEVVREYANDVPEVPIYPDELGQVWTNMIGNAVQAMGESGRLTVSIANGKPGYVEVSINDNGPGIPAEIQKRIFEPFFTTKPQGQGTGLGLDISRKIIEKHQGEVRVESRPGSTTFTVSLPVNPTQHQQVLDSIPQV